MASRAEKEGKVNDALWKFGAAVKAVEYDPDHDDETQGVCLPPQAAEEALVAIMKVVEGITE